MEIANIKEDYKLWSEAQFATEKQINFLMMLIGEYLPDNHNFDFSPILDELMREGSEELYNTFIDFFEKMEENIGENIKIPWSKINNMIIYLKTKLKIDENDPKMINKKYFRPIRNVIEILHSNIDYEIGIQKSKYCKDGFMKYIKFYEMMMIDIDNNHNTDRANDIEKLYILLDKLEEKIYAKICQYLKYRIYKTRNGYHIFITSHIINYNSKIAEQIARLIGCDEWYILYFKYHGYCVRLSPKLNDFPGNYHEFVTQRGHAPGEIDYCTNLIKIMEQEMLF